MSHKSIFFGNLPDPNPGNNTCHLDDLLLYTILLFSITDTDFDLQVPVVEAIFNRMYRKEPKLDRNMGFTAGLLTLTLSSSETTGGGLEEAIFLGEFLLLQVFVLDSSLQNPRERLVVNPL